LNGTLVLRNAAISTSGDTEQFVEIGGVRYAHIVDPSTGLGLTHRVQTTVVARRATTTDALGTALTVLGTDRGLPLVERMPGVAAIFITREDGRDVHLESRRFRALPRAELSESR
jgi:thiamine biosynthesis lipoprotein